jgi:hypothetical protein
MEIFTESEVDILKTGLSIDYHHKVLTEDECRDILGIIKSFTAETKLSEVQYGAMAQAVGASYLRGFIERDAYSPLLKKISSFRAMQSDKPVVQIFDVTFVKFDATSEVARGTALNHPRLGRGFVRTSLVIEKGDGYFETLNTRYEIVESPKQNALSEEE